MELIWLIIVGGAAWFTYKYYLGYISNPGPSNPNIIKEIIQNTDKRLLENGITQDNINLMCEYISEYINNKYISIRDLDFIEIRKQQNILICPKCISANPLYINLKRAKRLSSDKIQFRCKECQSSQIFSKENYMRSIYDNEKDNDYLKDQQKLHGLFLQKDININYFDLIPLINKIETSLFYEFSVKSIIEPALIRIRTVLGDTTDAVSIIKEYYKMKPELSVPSIISEKYEFWLISKILQKSDVIDLNDELSRNEQVIFAWIEVAQEQISLESFEKTLGKETIPILYDYTVLNGIEFEQYVKKVFQHLGYKVSDTSTTGDQGADLLLYKAEEKTVVQVKNHSNNVSNKAIQEAVAAMKYYNAKNAMVVISSSFTQGAIDLATKNGVDLWNGQKLRAAAKLINDG